MQKQTLRLCLSVFIGSLVVLGVLAWASYSYHLFYLIRWLDKVLHIVGGFSIGALAFVVSAFWEEGSYNRQHVLLTLVLLTLMIGIGWEALEFNMGRFTGDLMRSGALDTATDLFADVIGALCAFYVLHGRVRNG